MSTREILPTGNYINTNLIYSLPISNISEEARSRLDQILFTAADGSDHQSMGSVKDIKNSKIPFTAADGSDHQSMGSLEQANRITRNSEILFTAADGSDHQSMYSVKQANRVTNDSKIIFKPTMN